MNDTLIHIAVIVVAGLLRFGVAIASKFCDAHAYDDDAAKKWDALDSAGRVPPINNPFTRYHTGTKNDTWHIVRRYGERYGSFLAYVPAAAYHGLTLWLVAQTAVWIVAAAAGWWAYKVKWR